MSSSKRIEERIPDIPLSALGTVCFLTIFMCQTRFKISKEMNPEVIPPVFKNKDCWLMWTYGNADRYKFVLKAVIVITSPLLSFISTALLLYGKSKMNPYLFLPWLLLTARGLLTIQTENLVNMFNEMATRTNLNFGFHVDDWKWCVFYLTIIIFNAAECIAFYEVYDFFTIIWRNHPYYIMALAEEKKEQPTEAPSKASLRPRKHVLTIGGYPYYSRPDL